MEPFIKPAGESAGREALDTLFAPREAPAAPARTSGTPKSAPAPESSPEALPAEGDTPSALDPGELGSLGDVPGAEATEVNAEGQPAASQGANPFVFSVTDDKGRRKVSVDLNDKEKMARILPQAFGFRKMQAERDVAQTKLKDIEPKYQELDQNWKTLEKTYQEGGVEGLVDLLGGRVGHYKDFIAGEIQRSDKYKSATQAEKDRMDLQAKVERMERDSKTREENASKQAATARTEREAAELASLEAQITPTFNKYRFAGTLGNESQEKAFDQAIWDQSIRNLEAVPEGTPLTSQMIDAEFKRVAQAFKAAIGKQVTTKTREAIASTKAAAAGSVAAAATRGLRSPQTAQQSMEANVKRGGIGGLTAGLMDALRMSR